jgi:HEAT repeat protein
MNRLSGFFRVHPGEGRSALLITALMFLLFAGMYIGAPGIESLFLTRFGFQSLPYMFIALGLVTAAVTILITTLMRRIPQQLLYRILPIILALALGLSRFLIEFDLVWLYPILFLCIYIFWTVQNLFSWGTAGMVYHTRQAKRLFPLFGAGGIFGSAVGGLVTRPLVSVIGAANLILVWGGSLVVGAVIIEVLIRSAQRTRGATDPVLARPSQRLLAAKRRRSARKEGLFSSVRQGYTYVTSSKFMRWFALAAVFYGILYFVLLFPFSREAALQFPDADTLAGFLGLFQGSAMAAGFLLSLLAANRLFARIGFVPSIWILAIIYLIGFTAVSLSPAFHGLIAFRFFQLSWHLGIAVSAYQAVFNIVPPKQREQTRMFVTGIARQLGISIAGGVLVVVRLFFPLQTAYFAGAGCAAAAVVIVLIAGKTYRQALFEALRAGRPDVFVQGEQPFGGFRRDDQAASVALAGISAEDPHVRRISAEILGSLRLPEATDALVAALEDPEGEVRAAVLAALGSAGASPALLEVSSRLRDPVPEVRLQALRELRKLSPYSKGLAVHLEPLLDDPDAMVRANAAAVLLGLAVSRMPEEVLRELIESQDVYDRISALRACGQWPSSSCCDLIKVRLQDPDPNVRCEALRALAEIDAAAAAEPLIRALGDESRFVAAIAASLIHRAGAAALPALIAGLEEPQLETGALQALLCYPLRELQTQRGPLRAFAERKVAEIRRYRVLLAQQETLSLNSNAHLSDALKNRLMQSGIAAIAAAGLLSDPHAAAAAIEDLRSPNGEQKANALEMLDGLKEKAIVGEVLPLFERGIETEASDRAEAVDPVSFLVAVMGERDPWLRACAVYSATDVSEPRIRACLESLSADGDSLVRETAQRMLNGGHTMKTLPALSTLERIFFLEKVPLFADFAPAELKQVAAICQEQEFADGEPIGWKGEIGEEMYVILSGEVRVLADETTGEELARRVAGEYVGEMAIISREPRMATMIASGAVRVLSISQPEFEQILRQCREASMAVMRVLCARLREAQNAHRN